MATNRLIGDYPVIGIRPTIDGRRGILKVRESLEEQTMGMAKAAPKLFTENLKYSNGEPVKVVIADTTIGRVPESAACAEKFKKEGVDITLTVTPCWCYGSETMDMDPKTIKGVWGFNGTERPGAVYLASVLASIAQKGLPAFGIYGHDVQNADATDIPEDVQEKLLRFGRAAVAVATMRGKSYLQIGSICMGIAGSIISTEFFEEYLGMRVESVDEVEIIRRMTEGIYDHAEFEKALKWTKENCKQGFDKNPDFCRKTDAEKEEAFWNKLYKNEYNTLKPVICLNILNDKNDVIYVNNHAKDMLQGFTKQINAVENESSDLIIFIPKNRYFAKNKQLAYDSLSHVLNHDNLQQLNIQYIEYSETEYFSYLDTSRINGIEKSKNPIIIYQANKDLAVNGGYLESYKAGAVLFQCDEKQLRNISKKYEDMLGNYQLVITNVHEQYLYNHTFLIKLVGFLSSLCTIVLLLNIMIIVTVSRLEFRENAMKISLMKIFGYSLFERHKTLLKMIVVENFVILVGMLIYSLLSVQTEVGISILVSSFMALIEFTIIFFNITIVEKTNIPKSLKGGCL